VQFANRSFLLVGIAQTHIGLLVEMLRSRSAAWIDRQESG
jgi:hypothetical protein